MESRRIRARYSRSGVPIAEPLYGNADSLASEFVTNSKSHDAHTQWR